MTVQFFEEINFEFTSLGTKQKNGIVEWGFDTFYYRMHMMMSHMGINDNLNTFLFHNCSENVTKLQTIMVNPHKEKRTYGKFYNNMPDNEILKIDLG